MTGGTYFTGGNGVGIAFEACGIRDVFGVEYDDKIAQVARDNGFPVTTADVRDIDPASLPRVDWFHASPVCKNASTAKADGEESPEDLETAQAVERYIDHHKPRIFSLENVWGYREFQAFADILKCLKRNGYTYDYWHLNSADYGGWILCPIHDTNFQTKHVGCAGSSCRAEIARDIAQSVAMMQPDAQAKHLAWDVAARLVKATNSVTVARAMQKELERNSAVRLAKKTRNGRAGKLLTSADISRFESTGDTAVSIEWLLNQCSDANYLRQKWSTIKTEIWQTTALIISKCLQTMVNTQRTTTPYGAQNDCLLCRYSAVPQTRKRLILVARRDGIKPRKPQPTHTENPAPMFDERKKWVGWYEAIEDLIPTLPPSQFAKWQLKRLPQEIKTMLFANGGFDGGIVNVAINAPANTITSNQNQTSLRAFLTNLDNASREFTIRQEDEPYPTLTASAMRRNVSTPKAYITAGGDAWSPVLDDTAPLFTLSSSKAEHATRAYLVNESSTMEIADAAQPANAQVSSARNVNQKAYLQYGRVVKMTPRALARFQSFPDTYTLPEKASLACTIIGNAVPPLLMQRVIEAQND